MVSQSITKDRAELLSNIADMVDECIPNGGHMFFLTFLGDGTREQITTIPDDKLCDALISYMLGMMESTGMPGPTKYKIELVN